LEIKSKPLGQETKNIYFFENQFFEVSETRFWKKLDFGNFEATSKINNVYIDNPDFSIIPIEIWDHISENQKKEVFNNSPSTTNIKSEKPHIDSYIYWAISKELQKMILSKIPNVNLKHFAESISFFKENKNQIKVFVGERIIYISSYVNNKLTLLNRFNFENSDDILYYFLSVVKESQLTQEPFHLDYMGIENQILLSKIKEILPQTKINIYKETDFNNH